jgi:replicative DNA helicase
VSRPKSKSKSSANGSGDSLLAERTRDLERRLLGAAMFSTQAALAVAASLEPAQLLDPLARSCLIALQKLLLAGAEVTPTTVAHEVAAQSGADYDAVVRLAEPTLAEADVAVLLAETREAIELRRIEALCRVAAARIGDRRPESGAAAQVREELLAGLLAEDAATVRSVGWEEAQRKALEELRERRQRAQAGIFPDRIEFGISGIDELIGGIERGELVEIAGPTGSGKTLLAMHLADAAALSGKRVLIFSAEMRAEQLALRELARRSRIFAWKMRRPETLDANDLVRLEQVIQALPIRVCDGMIHPDMVWQTMELERRTRGLDLVVVDYDQLVVEAGMDGRAWSREENFFSFQRDFILRAKQMAQKAQCAFCLLCQLRKVAHRDGTRRRPLLDDLYGDSSIRNHPDVILWIVREMFDHHMDPRMSSEVTVWVLKARNGRTGRAELEMDEDFLELRDWPPDRYRYSRPAQFRKKGEQPDEPPETFLQS